MITLVRSAHVLAAEYPKDADVPCRLLARVFASDAIVLLHEATAGAMHDLDCLAAAALRETERKSGSSSSKTWPLTSSRRTLGSRTDPRATVRGRVHGRDAHQSARFGVHHRASSVTGGRASTARAYRRPNSTALLVEMRWEGVRGPDSVGLVRSGVHDDVGNVGGPPIAVPSYVKPHPAPTYAGLHSDLVSSGLQQTCLQHFDVISP